MKPLVKSDKNDFVDAGAIAEAADRKNMRFVPIKTDDQLDLQAIHRIRDRLVSRPTAVINQIRAFLWERGMVFAQKPARLKAAMADTAWRFPATTIDAILLRIVSRMYPCGVDAGNSINYAR